MFSFEAEVFFCSLDISELQFLIKKIFHLYFSSYVLGHQNPGQTIIPRPVDPDSLEMLDPDPDSVNPDPQLWVLLFGYKRTKVHAHGEQ